MSLQQKLYALFLLDQQARGLNARVDAAGRRLHAQQARLNKLHEELAEITDRHKHVQAHANTLENQSKDTLARIDKLRQAMNNVTSNKEYSALLVEVNSLKVDNGKVEEEALQEIAKVEALEAEISGLKNAIAEQTKIVELSQKDVATAKAEIAEQLDDVVARRDAARAELSEEEATTFDKTADLHDGEALAEVVEENRRRMEYSCGGCYMAIPVERLNTLMTSNQIVFCPNCSRILYVGESLRDSMGAKK